MQFVRSTRLAVFGLMLVLLVGVLPVSAQGDVTTGADFMPADTVLYASIRTDQGYIETLDGVLNGLYAQVQAALPPELASELPPVENPVSLALLEGTQGEFENIRPWLGEEVAIGVGGDLSGETDPGVVLFVSITDRAAALAYLEMNMNLEDVTTSEADGYTIIVDNDGEGALAANDTQVIITNKPDLLPTTLDATLAGSDAFSKAVSSLPAESYNIMVYADGARLVDLAQSAALTDAFVDPATLDLLADLQGNVGTLALGATILDGDTLTIDLSQQATVEMFAGVEPLSNNFVASLPEVDLLIHANDLNGQVTTALDGVGALAEEEAADGTPVQTVDQILDQLNGLMLMTLGIDFTTDTVGWMTGDYALYIDYQPVAPGEPSLITAITDPATAAELDSLGIEIGFVTETTDLAAANAVVDAMETVLQDPGAAESGITTAREDIGGANALVISLEQPGLPIQQAVIGANESVFVLGTRASAEAILTGAGGFTDNALVQDATNYLLDQASSVWYLDGPQTIIMGGDIAAAGLIALGPAIESVFSGIVMELDPDAEMEPSQPDPAMIQAQIQQVQQIVRDLSGLLDHATISTSYVDGIYRVRATISLGG